MEERAGNSRLEAEVIYATSRVTVDPLRVGTSRQIHHRHREHSHCLSFSKSHHYPRLNPLRMRLLVSKYYMRWSWNSTSSVFINLDNKSSKTSLPSTSLLTFALDHLHVGEADRCCYGNHFAKRNNFTNSFQILSDVRTT